MLPASTSVPQPEYRLQAEVVQGLQPRSHDPFFHGKKGFAGLKALVDFRLKPVLRPDCDHHAGTVPSVLPRPTARVSRYGSHEALQRPASGYPKISTALDERRRQRPTGRCPLFPRLYPAPSGLVCFRLVTQGVALGWYVSPLQGCQEWRGHSCLRAYTRADRNVCPTLV